MNPQQQKAVSTKGVLSSKGNTTETRRGGTGLPVPTQKVAAGSSEVQGHLWLRRESEASLGYRPSQKQLNKEIQKFSTKLSTDNTNNQKG